MQVSSFIPFVLMADSGSHLKLNKVRIIEAIIIACLGGLAAGYIATREMAVEMNHLKAQISRVSEQINCLDNRLWQHQTQTEGKDK